MKLFYLALFFVLLVFPAKNYCYLLPIQSDRAANIACELCLKGEGSAGFIACQALLDKYQEDERSKLFLREHMVLCLVENKYLQQAKENGEYIIKNSKDPLYIAAGWYQKSEYAFSQRDFQGALAYAKVSISWLEKTEICSKQWQAYRDAFLSLAHRQRQKAFEELNDLEHAEEEKQQAEALKTKLGGQLKY